MIEKTTNTADAIECHHIVRCAITPEEVSNATEMLRSGRSPEALIGAAMLAGECRTKTKSNATK